VRERTEDSIFGSEHSGLLEITGGRPFLQAKDRPKKIMGRATKKHDKEKNPRIGRDGLENLQKIGESGGVAAKIEKNLAAAEM